MVVPVGAEDVLGGGVRSAREVNTRIKKVMGDKRATRKGSRLQRVG